MPTFDAYFRWLAHVIVIALLSAGLYFAYNFAIQPMFNAFVTGNLVLNKTIVGMQISGVAIMVFAIVALFLGSVGAILVANARAEVNSPFIAITMAGSIVCCFTILNAMIMYMFLAAVGDPLIITYLTAFPLPVDGPLAFTSTAVTWLNSLVHYAAIFSIVWGYYKMFAASVRIESIQWSL